MMTQVTAAALASENKALAHPASVDSIPTGAGWEDHVSMAPIAGRHARAVIENASRVVAMELLCACRALEFRRPLLAGSGTERLYGAVRRLVPAPEGDRPFGAACETLARWILSPAPARLAEEVLAHPASVDSIPTGAGWEDHVSMAPIAGRHARSVVENASRVVAMELLCACRALELRRPLLAGSGSERLYGAVRRLVPAPEGDRPLSSAAETLARWVLSAAPSRLADEVLAS